MSGRWPVEPGDYYLGEYESPVAITTLTDLGLLERLRSVLRKEHYSLLGLTSTPNIGVEKLVRNIVSNPHIAYLVITGRDESRPSVAETILHLKRNGLDGSKRVVGYKAVRLPNLTMKEVEVFKLHVEILDYRSASPDEVVSTVSRLSTTHRKPRESVYIDPGELGVRVVAAEDDSRVRLDEKGFFIVYVDHASKTIICEHYDNKYKKTTVIKGRDAKSIYKTVVKMNLLSRLDHAAYLGRELTRAEHALAKGEKYLQDHA